ARPATRVREMAQFLRQALAGERVVFRGEPFAVDGFRLVKPPVEPVPIHIAALRPGMLRVAGEVGDGAILNWLSTDDVPKSVAVVREAAAGAGRDPATIEITARLLVNLDPPGPAADTAVRRHVTAYLNVPVYRAFHEWLGPAAALGPMWGAWGRPCRRALLSCAHEKPTMRDPRADATGYGVCDHAAPDRVRRRSAAKRLDLPTAALGRDRIAQRESGEACLSGTPGAGEPQARDADAAGVERLASRQYNHRGQRRHAAGLRQRRQRPRGPHL